MMMSRRMIKKLAGAVTYRRGEEIYMMNEVEEILCPS